MNYVLHRAAYANKLKYVEAEARGSASFCVCYNHYVLSIQVVNSLFRDF